MTVSISTVIPSYNHARFVARAIDSVLSQDVPGLELIVVDDGSTDGSVALLKKLSEDRGFKLITQHNQGTHCALNRGLKEARGDYLAILNSDDVFDGERFRHLLSAAQSTNSPFLYTSVEFINEADQPIPSHPRARFFAQSWQLSANCTGAEGFLLDNPAISSSNFFFRRDFWEKVGNFRNLRYTHDWDWALRASAIGEPKRLDIPLLKYRIHGANTLLEDAVWRKICENAFIFASSINRAGFGQPAGSEATTLHRYFDLLLENNSFLPYSTLLFLGILKAGDGEDEILNAMADGSLLEQIQKKAADRDLPTDLFLSTARLKRFLLGVQGNVANSASFRKSLQLRLGRVLRRLALLVEGK